MRFILSISSLLVITTFYACNEEPKHILIQPFDDVPAGYTAYIVDHFKQLYPDVRALPPIALPVSAYYEPKHRYRADTIIRWLRDRTENSSINIGLTTKDISTAKGDVKDWGVIGLGYRPGIACVVSSFRLNKSRTKEQLFKVVLHELGHTVGLKHCKEKTCFMRAAEGGNPTDEETGFCSSCKKRLSSRGWEL